MCVCEVPPKVKDRSNGGSSNYNYITILAFDLLHSNSFHLSGFFPLLETKRVNSLVEQPSHRTLRKEPRLSDYFCGMIPTKKTRGVERARERDVREAYVFSLRCFYYYYVDIGSRKTVSRAQIQKLVIHTHSEGT